MDPIAQLAGDLSPTQINQIVDGIKQAWHVGGWWGLTAFAVMLTIRGWRWKAVQAFTPGKLAWLRWDNLGTGAKLAVTAVPPTSPSQRKVRTPARSNIPVNSHWATAETSTTVTPNNHTGPITIPTKTGKRTTVLRTRFHSAAPRAGGAASTDPGTGASCARAITPARTCGPGADTRPPPDKDPVRQNRARASG